MGAIGRGAGAATPGVVLPMRHAAAYRVRFDEAGPTGLLRGSALLGYVQDCAWRHSEALGFPRDWYRVKGVAWLVRAVGAEIVGPMTEGETLTVTTQLTGSRRVMMRRRTDVASAAGELRAVVTIDWVMTDGRAPVRIPAEFEQAPIDGPGPFEPIRVDLPATPLDAISLPFAPRLRELDPMNHANNGVYLDWLDEAISAVGAGGRAAVEALPRTYRMEYLRPAGPGAPLVSSAWADPAAPAPGGPTSVGWAYRLTDPAGTDLLRGRLAGEAERRAARPPGGVRGRG
jgi:acyl-CoA thioesterase FadM